MIYDIAFYVLVVVLSFWIAKELIPEHIKQYWNYLMSVRQDKRKGVRRKYSFSFKVNPRIKDE